MAIACDIGPGSGIGALLAVDGATYASGELADVSDTGGPAVIQTYARTSWVTPGQRGKFFQGTLATGATAVLLGLDGDGGYWILPASAPDTLTPDEPTFQSSLGFASTLTGKTAQLRVVAVDLVGRMGPSSLQSFDVLPSPPPTGALVVSLHWDSEADLDLHAVDPSGFEIGPAHIVSLQADGTVGPTAGVLDFDSNANCLIDGRRSENVTWAAPAPGHYVVRVDNFSLCSAPAAHWDVFVVADGVLQLHAQGVSTVADARFAKGTGTGVFALDFDWSGGG